MQKKLVALLLVITCLATVYLAFKAPAPSTKPAANWSPRGQVGVVRIEGTISSSSTTLWGDAATSLDDMLAALKQARERNDIKAVVIRIDSPGGTVAAAQELGREIEKIKKAGKPVIASMGDVAASGGYWVAASCDQIVANPGTMTGSIGVIMEIENYEGLMQKLGIRSEVIKSGAMKDIGSATRSMTPEERKVLEAMVMDSYNQFLEQVKKGRKGKIDEAKLPLLADGRVFTGRQALKLGFVDKLGGLSDAIELAGKEAGLGREPSYEELLKPDPFRQFINMFSSRSLLENLVDRKKLESVY